MNNFSLVGQIVEAPERYESNNGVKICRLRISVVKNAKEDEYEIFEVSLFRGNAIENYEIGQYVAVNGRLSANNVMKDNNTYYNVNLIGNSISVINH